MAITNDNFLNMWEVLVNQVFGDPVLFIISVVVSILVIAGISKFSNPITLMILLVFSLFMSNFITALLPFTILLAMGFIGQQVSRLINRG